MALKAYDGFDHYNSTSDMATRNGYLQYTIGTLDNIFQGFVQGPFGFGFAAQFFSNSSAIITSTLADRNAAGFVGVRMLWSIGGGQEFQFHDSVADKDQVTVVFNPLNFSVQIYRGPSSGTGSALLYTTGNNVWTSNTWNFIEIGVVIDNSTGSVKVKVNNVQVATVTGVDTQNSGNAWYDQITFFENSISSSSTTTTFDDLYVLDAASGPGPNPYNDFLGDARCVTLFAIGDDAVQFTPFVTSETLGSVSTGNTWNSSADELSFAPFITQFSGSLGTSLSLNLNANVVGHVVLGIYDSDGPGGGPGTLLVQATPLTNPTTGLNVFTLATAIDIENNHQYYWGVNQDATAVLRSGGAAVTWNSFTSAYNATMPADVSADTMTTTAGHTLTVTGTVTVTNFGNVNEIHMDSDTSYNFSNTVTDEDLLNFQALPIPIDLILAVQLTGAYRKDDAGTRAVKQALKSGATEVYGSTDYLSTEAYVYFTDLWELDPHTGTTWTASNVNALAAGYNVAV